MSLNCGIVGLPNVGKSTLFNALTNTQAAEAANYPFCTISPNTGIVNIIDKRLDTLAELNKSEKTLYAKLEIVDIAGLVKGAHSGEGLGNQFLHNIREVNAIIHVLRCFEDESIVHVNNSINPLADAEIVNLELVIADLDVLEKRVLNIKKKKGKSSEEHYIELINSKLIPALRDGVSVRDIQLTEEEQQLTNSLQLLSNKPIMYVCNVEEDNINTGNNHSKKVLEWCMKNNTPCINVSAQIEQEISTLSNANERNEYMEALGITETGLDKIITQGYKLLKLQHYFTAGPKEARAWQIKKNDTAVEAARVIHNDFARGFICAEIISYNDYINTKSYNAAKEKGLVQQCGKNHTVQDGDVILFRFNV